MSGFLGMDTDEMRGLTRRFEQRAEQLSELGTRLTSLIEATAWTGEDADGFRGRWTDGARPLIIDCAAELRQCATTLEADTDGQETSSGVGTDDGAGAGGGDGTGGGGTPSGGRGGAPAPEGGGGGDGGGGSAADGPLVSTLPGEGHVPGSPPGAGDLSIGSPIIPDAPIVCDPPMPPVSTVPPIEIGPAPVFPLPPIEIGPAPAILDPPIDVLPGDVVTLPDVGIVDPVPDYPTDGIVTLPGVVEPPGMRQWPVEFLGPHPVDLPDLPREADPMASSASSSLGHGP